MGCGVRGMCSTELNSRLVSTLLLNSCRLIAGKFDTYSAGCYHSIIMSKSFSILFVAVAEVYDEGYINMAPSGATAKPFVHSRRNGNCKIAEQQQSNCV